MILRALSTDRKIPVIGGDSADAWQGGLLDAISVLTNTPGTIRFEASAAEISTLTDFGLLQDGVFNHIRVREVEA